MTEQVEPTAVPRRVRNTGLVAAALGALMMLGGYGFAVTGMWIAGRSLAAEPNQTLPFMIAHSVPIGTTQAAFGALVLIAGLALVWGREWGRRGLAAVVCLYMVFVAGYLFLVARGYSWEEQAFMAAITAVELGLLGLALRWLRSPSIRAGCR